MKKTIINLFPYFTLLVFSFFATYLYFYEGLNKGDDYYFHLPNILEQYKTLLEGHKLSAISGYIGMGLGVGNRLFYSPLPHLTVATMALFLNVFKVSLMTSYKIVLILSVFISGIFMYRFTLHFTKNNKIAALIAACCFVLYPYRLFDAFCRLAFAEAYSIMFLPLFMMGLYDITHFEDDIKVMPFVEVILGGSLLYLSHNITAFYMFIIGIIYLLVNIKNIIRLFKKKNYILYCGISIILLVGISSIALFSQFELMNTDLYNLTDRVRMWTNVEQVITRVKEQFNYSGFLNIPFLMARFQKYVTLNSLIVDLVMYVIVCSVVVVIDKVLQKLSKVKKFHLLISGAMLYLLISLFSRRIEVYLAITIFYFLYIYIDNKTKQEEKIIIEDKLYKNNLFIFSIAVIIIAFFMMENAFIWTILPSIMLNIQFPWRLWAIVQIFISILIGLLCHYFNFKKVTHCALAILVGLLMVGNMPLLEKRLYSYTDYENRWQETITDSYLDSGIALGFNKEYCPQVFFDNKYKPEYDNSLYYQVKSKIPYDTTKYEDYSIKPVFLTGKGNIIINDCFAPNYDMSITITDEGIIQMPLLYYPGYQISITNKQTNEKIDVKGENIDGLIAFSISEGEYEVYTDYIGTPLRQSSIVICVISSSVTIIALIYALIFEKKKRTLILKN